MKCPKCKRAITPDIFACQCGEIFIRITGLQPKQRQMLALIEAVGDDVATKPGFGGSRGAAKSRILRDAMLLRRFRHPGTAGFIIRRNWSDLEENHLERFKLERPGLMQFYSNSRQSFEFPNGSRIAFRYADTTDEVRAISRGPEAMDIAIDQAEQFTADELALLTTPNRWPGKGPGECKTWFFFNVGDRGAEYLRRVYWLKQYVGAERPTDYAFIQAYGFDNFEWFRNEIPGLTFDDFYDERKYSGALPGLGDFKHYDEEWLKSLPENNRFKMFVTRTTEGRKMWAQPETIRMGDLFGDFTAFSGQYFSGVWQEKKCVIDPNVVEEIVKPWWTHWIGIDWGFAHSAACGWFASGKVTPAEMLRYFNVHVQFPMEIVVLKRELVVNRMGEGDFSQMIATMTPDAEKRVIRDVFLSPDAWHKRGSANPIAEQMATMLKQGGLNTPTSADDDRAGGWRLMWNCLKQTTSMLAEVPAVYPGNFPMLFFSSDCVESTSAMTMLITDPRKREDVLKTDTTYDDVADCLRYGIYSKLKPTDKVPRDVRVQEVLKGAGEDPNARAMSMRIFEANEVKTQRVIARPRWRM